jgi:hypothetical protein
MSYGKETCKILKEIRQQIADKNEIEYITSECHFQGECQGTCPKCEEEVKYIENELHKRKQLGKVASIAGIATVSFGMAMSTATFSSCDKPLTGDFATEEERDTTQVLTGDPLIYGWQENNGENL